MPGLRRHSSETPIRVEVAADVEIFNQLRMIVVVSAVTLIALAAINSMVAAAFAARDNARNHAIVRAVGATPQQTVLAFVVAQLGACLAGCAIGIPLGILALNTLGGPDLATAQLPAPAYVAIGLIAIAVYVAIVIVPARILAGQAVTSQLAYE